MLFFAFSKVLVQFILFSDEVMIKFMNVYAFCIAGIDNIGQLDRNKSYDRLNLSKNREARLSTIPKNDFSLDPDPPKIRITRNSGSSSRHRVNASMELPKYQTDSNSIIKLNQTKPDINVNGNGDYQTVKINNIDGNNGSDYQPSSRYSSARRQKSATALHPLKSSHERQNHSVEPLNKVTNGVSMKRPMPINDKHNVFNEWAAVIKH